MNKAMQNAIRARRLPLGLVVRATFPAGSVGLDGVPNDPTPREYSFATVESRDSFMDRAAANGAAVEILKS